MKHKLTELDWDRVYQIRCRSKQGKQPTDDELRLLERALREDRGRYVAMDRAIFNETHPGGPV